MNDELQNRQIARRRLLRRAGTAVAGVAGAAAVGAAIASPAEADPGQSLTIGAANTGGAVTTGLSNNSGANPTLALSNAAVTTLPSGFDMAGAPLVLTPLGDFVNGPLGSLGVSADGTLWSSIPGQQQGTTVSDFVRTGGNSTFVKTFSPIRILDTRTNQAGGKAAMLNGLDPNVRDQVTGQVLAQQVLNVTLDSLLHFGWSLLVNITVVAGNNTGFVTAFPGGKQRPVASNVNYAANQVVANFAIVSLGTFGTQGQQGFVQNGISLFAFNPTQIILDVCGAVVNYDDDVISGAGASGFAASGVAAPDRVRPAHLIGHPA